MSGLAVLAVVFVAYALIASKLDRWWITQTVDVAAEYHLSDEERAEHRPHKKEANSPKVSVNSILYAVLSLTAIRMVPVAIDARDSAAGGSPPPSWVGSGLAGWRPSCSP